MDMSEERTILTVEDNPNIRKMIAYNLRRAGFRVIEAGDGKEAVRVLQKVVPDLIVLDVRMPEMNGFQLLELMRKYPRAAAIPVLMLSALSQPENVDRALALGVVDYVVKPLDPSSLIAKIRSALENADELNSEDGSWQGSERRAGQRASVGDLDLNPRPGGRMIDLSEGGISWRCKVPPSEGDVIELDSPGFFNLLNLEPSPIRLRVVYVRSIGLGYSRVGACFIGLNALVKQALRTTVGDLLRNSTDSTDGEAPVG